MLAERADTVIVGGGMAFTFLAAQGHSVGSSLIDASHLEQCRELLARGNVLIPVDALGLPSGAPFGRGGRRRRRRLFGADIPEGAIGLDIGPATTGLFAGAISSAATILWNGPMGVFEDARFCAGTEAVARAVAASGATSGRGRRRLGRRAGQVRSRAMT